jgi:hypothetical protein
MKQIMTTTEQQYRQNWNNFFSCGTKHECARNKKLNHTTPLYLKIKNEAKK